jgi:hypothetical protein
MAKKSLKITVNILWIMFSYFTSINALEIGNTMKTYMERAQSSPYFIDIGALVAGTLALKLRTGGPILACSGASLWIEGLWMSNKWCRMSTPERNTPEQTPANVSGSIQNCQISSVNLMINNDRRTSPTKRSSQEKSSFFTFSSPSFKRFVGCALMGAGATIVVNNIEKWDQTNIGKVLGLGGLVICGSEVIRKFARGDKFQSSNIYLHVGATLATPFIWNNLPGMFSPTAITNT